MSEQNSNAVLAKINQLRLKVGAIGKNRRMEMGGGRGYNYRGIDDLYEALSPVMSELGLVSVPNIVPGSAVWDSLQVTDRNGNPKVSTRCKLVVLVTVCDVDTGQSIVGSAVGEGVDDSDKAAGKATTYAMKNFWFHHLNIPTEDPDAERPDPADHKAKSKGKDRVTTRVTQEEFRNEAAAFLPGDFSSAKDMAELKAQWDAIPVDKRTDEVIAAKNKRKDELTSGVSA